MRSYQIVERDFNVGIASGEWTIVQDGTGSFTNAGTVGGWLSVAPDNTTDNEEIYAKMPSNVAFAADKPAMLAFSMALTEANTDDANIILGLSSTGAANTLVDDGGGPPSNYDGAVFFKVDGTMKWQTETSHTTTQQTSATAADFASATTYDLSIFWDGSASVNFWVNGVLVATHTTAGALPTANMGITVGVKNGGAHKETLTVDWLYLQAARTALGTAGSGLGMTEEA
jgi:hypothetical protein